jgi:hypothetical protein
MTKKPPSRNTRKSAAPERAPVAYLSESEAAKRLGIDESTLHQWALIWIAAKPENELAARLAKARLRRAQLPGRVTALLSSKMSKQA